VEYRILGPLEVLEERRPANAHDAGSRVRGRDRIVAVHRQRLPQLRDVGVAESLFRIRTVELSLP
jgi:hypothetical protein